ncbi:hypothetical protein, partial [uncultured Faecalibaculum sp.]|uniref:hypothetical protein n=1 Tax=uncultured Faecalibaculum sp. TaxID=1729681 RepID=UPI002711EB48
PFLFGKESAKYCHIYSFHLPIVLIITCCRDAEYPVGMVYCIELISTTPLPAVPAEQFRLQGWNGGFRDGVNCFKTVPGA